MWVSVTLAVLIELVPSKIKTTSVAVYFFIISNIGGNMPLLVPAIKPLFEARGFDKTESLRCEKKIIPMHFNLFIINLLSL